MSNGASALSLDIVRMQAHHLKELAELERLCFSLPWSYHGLAEERLNPRAVFFVAEGAGEIMGYAGMHHVLDEGNIANIAVFPRYRRRAVGRRLMEALIDYARENGITRLSLEVRPSNAAAIALYTSLGFTQAGRRRGFYTEPAEDATVMLKTLPAVIPLGDSRR